MRITFILSSLWMSGGVRNVVEYANRLSRRGHHLTLIIPEGTRDIDMAQELEPTVQVIQAKINFPAIQAKSMLIPKILLTFSLARSTPRSDVIISTHTPTTLASLIASRLRGRAKLVWYYQDSIETFTGKPLETWLAKNALRWHEKALVPSREARSELLSYSPGEVLVVGAGISHSEVFHPLPLEERQHDQKNRYILFLGDMRPRKGLYDFLEAASLVYQHIPNIRMWIVSKEDCQIQSDIPFDYIYRPSREELSRLYAFCDVFVSASWMESFGFPPLEAMACGAPVVMTETRGSHEYALPGKNCLLTPPRNPGELASAIVRVLTDEELAARLRKNGPLTAAGFSWDAAVDRFENALRDLF